MSGIAEDLNKMSAKATVKTLTGEGAGGESKLFRYIPMLTGSKNALKGAVASPVRRCSNGSVSGAHCSCWR